MITQARLKELLVYDPSSGHFYNLCKRNKSAVGDVVGSLHKTLQRRYVRLDGKRYLTYRLAWLYTYGEFPKVEIDHINRNPSDDRICNLREATTAQNQRNRNPDNTKTKSGVVGVCWHAPSKLWFAHARLNRKQHCIGYFKNLDEATEARRKFVETNFGAFATPR
jgi:hypothetical protein